MFKFQYDYMRLIAIGIICFVFIVIASLIFNAYLIRKYVNSGYQATMVIGNPMPIWQKVK